MAKRTYVPTDSTPSSSTAKHRSSSVDPRWRSDFPWNVLLLILDCLNSIHTYEHVQLNSTLLIHLHIRFTIVAITLRNRWIVMVCYWCSILQLLSTLKKSWEENCVCPHASGKRTCPGKFLRYRPGFCPI